MVTFHLWWYCRWFMIGFTTLELMVFINQLITAGPRFCNNHKYIVGRLGRLSNKHVWLVVWNMFYFSIYWECHHPNWLSYFVEGLKPPTRCEFKLILIYEMSFWSSISFKGKSVGITSTFGGNWVQHSSAWFPVYSIDCNFQQFSTMKKHMGIQHGDTLTINFGWCSPWWLNWRWWLRATPNEDMISVTQDWAIKYLGPLSSNGDIELAAARLARLMSERIKNFGGAQKQLQVYIYIYIHIHIYNIEP